MRESKRPVRRPPTLRQGRHYTVTEAARLLGVTQDEVYRLIDVGEVVVAERRPNRWHLIDGASLLERLGVAA